MFLANRSNQLEKKMEIVYQRNNYSSIVIPASHGFDNKIEYCGSAINDIPSR